MSDMDIEIGEDIRIVNWDGENDPKNPMNWPTWRKKCCVGIVTAITFITWVPYIFHSSAVKE